MAFRATGETLQEKKFLRAFTYIFVTLTLASQVVLTLPFGSAGFESVGTLSLFFYMGLGFLFLLAFVIFNVLSLLRDLIFKRA